VKHNTAHFGIVKDIGEEWTEGEHEGLIVRKLEQEAVMWGWESLVGYQTRQVANWGDDSQMHQVGVVWSVGMSMEYVLNHTTRRQAARPGVWERTSRSGGNASNIHPHPYTAPDLPSRALAAPSRNPTR